MGLYENMKADRITAMKAKDSITKSVLTTFLGDLQSQEKRGIEINDTYVIGQIKKAIQSCNENLKLKQDNKFQHEIDILEQYLPKQLTEVQLDDMITLLINEQGDKANIGSVMKALKERKGGQFDGKIASKLVREKLS